MIEPTVETLFDPKIIDLDIRAQTKDGVIKYLANLLYNAGYVNEIEDYVKDIYYRESQGVTGMGDGIAIPHGKSNSVKRIGLAIGMTRSLIPWESYDNKPVDIIFMFAVSDNTAGSKTHLKLLADVASRLGNEDIVQNIRKAKNVDELRNALFK